jgi:hypothetical protein
MERPAWRRLVRGIADTDDDEISCDECFDLVSDYVDLEIAGAAGDRPLPQLQQHLRQCGVCQDEYEILRDLARREAAGNPPSIDELRSSL